MRLPRLTGWLAGLALTIGIGITSVYAQPPGRPGRGGGDATNVDAMVKRVMTLDKDGDGSITLSDVKDQRLQPLLKRADANGDGVVTKDELTAQITKEAANNPRAGAGGGPGGGGQGGPGGPGGPDGGGPGGPGGRGPGGRPQPGQVLPAFMQDELQLTDTQRRDLQELQKDVDTRLAKILTAEQQQQLRQMQSRGPSGPGGPGGGGPGGGPPGGGPGGRQRSQQ